MLSNPCLIAVLAVLQGQCEFLIGSPLPDIETAAPSSGHHVDVGYGVNPADPATRIDLYKAPSPFPTPVLIEFHGGGWSKGQKGEFEPYMQDAGGVGIVEEAYAHGFSVVTVDYHLVTESAPPNCTPGAISNYFPAATSANFDAQRVVQYVRSRADEWGLDPDRIAGLGISAGGHLALWSSLTADASDADAGDPVLHHSSRLPWVVAVDTPTNLSADWISCNAAGDPPRPAICNYFGECSDVVISTSAFDRVRAVASPTYQALQHAALNQHFALYNVYRGNPGFTSSSQFSPALFPTTKVHHQVFGLLMGEALHRIGNDDVTWSVNLLLGEQEKCQTTLDVTKWLVDRAQAPILLRIEPDSTPIANPGAFAPSLHINLSDVLADDFFTSLANQPAQNAIELVLIGPAFSATLDWADLSILQSVGAVEIRGRKNRISIGFTPFNLGLFGGPVQAQLTVRQGGSLNVTRAGW